MKVIPLYRWFIEPALSPGKCISSYNHYMRLVKHIRLKMRHQSIRSCKGNDPFTLDEDSYRIIGH